MKSEDINEQVSIATKEIESVIEAFENNGNPDVVRLPEFFLPKDKAIELAIRVLPVITKGFIRSQQDDYEGEKEQSFETQIARLLYMLLVKAASEENFQVVFGETDSIAKEAYETGRSFHDVTADRNPFLALLRQMSDEGFEL